jgi:L-ribulose-5-phosphate 3-epimerase
VSLPVAAHTYSYIWAQTFEETLHHLAAMGHASAEAIVNPPHLWPSAFDAARRADIVDLMTRSGFHLVSLNCPSLDLNLTSPASEVREYSFQHYRQVIDLAADLGARFVCAIPGKVHPLLSAPIDALRGWLLGSLAALNDHARSRSVELLVENFPPGFLPKAEDLMAFLDDRALEGVGVVYDVANGAFAGEDPVHGLEVVAPRLRLVHLSDTGLDRYGHDDIGTGVVAFEQIAEALRRIGYEGVSVLEVISRDLSRADADLRRNMARLADAGWGVDQRVLRAGSTTTSGGKA